MTLPELRACLDRIGIKLDIEAGELTARAPAGVMTAEVKAGIREHKTALLGLLAGCTGRPPQSDPDRFKARAEAAARGDAMRAEGRALPLCWLPEPQPRAILGALPGRREDGQLWFE
jgi:hypothetical protein